MFEFKTFIGDNGYGCMWLWQEEITRDQFSRFKPRHVSKGKSSSGKLERNAKLLKSVQNQ